MKLYGSSILSCVTTVVFFCKQGDGGTLQRWTNKINELGALEIFPVLFVYFPLLGTSHENKA